ncbi:UvrD-helicase domain-containing protein [Actinosynnema sp. NPDC047251]|uniref:UvrD-like helicase ATP-binding domain-containing protein n=1 Tax=Saccharothrix espanaensis (strain ATCC 51144 / DSM 44229 / JCM 9112 / NBRC 15066 / NRRL 15764) TaxID=1179773 RepID=K0JPZ4_SACES|nr:UvrD-helicase domain-containing protein [Saccharothrix espanaensis]CCH29325.1 hypothetical protein BN6_20040 [Saccharothrix espanaensis DSM 44229]
MKARKSLTDQGYVTGHEIRIMAMHAFATRGDQVPSTVSTRFDELVVDEAQDCSQLDLAILTTLRQAGVPMVFVCDPDQAIYEFRGAQPDEVRRFGAELGSRIDLTGNWRSSGAICNLAATLRPTSLTRPPDDPIGPHHDEPAGILLIRTDEDSSDRSVTAFTERADAMGIPASKRLILAHAATSLPKQAASTAALPENAAVRIAWAATILTSPHHTARQRDTAHDTLERCLLGYWYSRTDGKSTVSLCDQLGVDRTELRRVASKLSATLPNVDDGTFGEWCLAVNKLLKSHPPGPGITRRADKTGSLRATTATKSMTARQAAGGAPAGSTTSTRVSIVQQVKGEEADAVLVILPPDKRTKRTDALVKAWISGIHDETTSESLHVLYVAATRARRLLALALPTPVHDQVAAHLKDNNVSVDLASATKPRPVPPHGEDVDI